MLPRYDGSLDDSLNAPAVECARRMFFQDYGWEDIYVATGVPLYLFEDLAFHRRPNWATEKQEVVSALLESSVKKGKVKELEQIVGLTLDGLRKFLSRLVLRETEITPKDAKLLSDIIANIDRISRLELGKATDIKRYEHMTPEQIKTTALEIVEQLKASDPVGNYGEEKVELPNMITPENFKH